MLVLVLGRCMQPIVDGTVARDYGSTLASAPHAARFRNHRMAPLRQDELDRRAPLPGVSLATR